MLGRNRFLTTLMGLFVTSTAFPCTLDGKRGFYPENDFNIPVNASQNGMTLESFNHAIDQVDKVYGPVVEKLGKKLVMIKNWEDGTVNAHALDLAYGPKNEWQIIVNGGIARQSTITKDALTLIVCHELGHFIGGAPKSYGSSDYGLGGYSNEGQSDYFATLKCLRKVWINDANEKIVTSLQPPQIVVDMCQQVYKNNKNETSLCIRTTMAGKSLADSYASVKGGPLPKFKEPKAKENAKWFFDDHPKPQCRLYTFFQGSLCNVSMNVDVSQTDDITGTCHTSLGHTIGTRPPCWYFQLK